MNRCFLFFANGGLSERMEGGAAKFKMTCLA
jgi:hypothetical protein